MRINYSRFFASVFFYSLLATALLTMSNCGGGGGGDSAPPPDTAAHRPVISNLQYSPSTVTQNQGGGSVTVTATMDFADQGGDLSTFTLTVYNSSGGVESVNTNPVQNVSGVNSGTLTLIVMSVDTITIGDYSFDIYVTDSAGDSSNRLSGTFRITSAANTIYDKTLILRGNWHFVYAIGSAVFTDDYSLSTMSTGTNPEGGYSIYGHDQHGNLVSATYWPVSGYWTLLDPGSIIDQFYIFYTDGNTILPNSCYYQITNSTEQWSRCYPLSGNKTSVIPGLIVQQNTLSTKQEKEKSLLMEKIDYAPIDNSIERMYLEQTKNINAVK